MTRNILTSLAVVFVLVFAVSLRARDQGTGDHPKDHPSKNTKRSQAGHYTPDSIEWSQGPNSLPAGAKSAVLEGDPKEPGLFTMRLRAPDGYAIPAHTHPKTERVTVISGTFCLAMGDKLDRSAAQRFPAGSFIYMPPGMKHAAWCEGDTIIQLNGEGPWEINYLNPADDPRNSRQTK